MRRWIPFTSAIVALVVGPGLWSGAWAGWSEDRVDAHAAGVARWIDQDLQPSDLGTGSAHFDGEWWFATHSFAAIGHLHAAAAHPDHQAKHLAAAEAALAPLLTCDAWRFESAKWGGECALAALGGTHDHAVLGYLNLPLSLHRLLRPDSDLAPLNDRISSHLEARLAANRNDGGLLETYPSIGWPADTAQAVASVALWNRAHGRPSPVTDAWSDQARRALVDPATGLLIQEASDGIAHRGDPRGSGTTLAIWALAYSDPAFARELWDAVRRELYTEALGFAAIREVPGGAAPKVDIDSGPVVLGQSVSATGFGIGAARAVGDLQAYRALYATAHAFGGPATVGDARAWAVGGPLGDALLFAFCTTPVSR